jgi:arabinose-5-phosphate isomerase
MGTQPQREAHRSAEAIQRMALEVAAAEVRGIQGLATLFGSEPFLEAVELLEGCRGRILIFGLGKSGLAGQRIAASLRSVGTPSIFIHPVEALHGDLGVVDPSDVAILISKSGENPEVRALIPTFRRLGVAIIGMTTEGGSKLARSVDVLLNLGPVEEIAPMSEVPTVSTTLFQVIGDALTIILCRVKGFTPEDFAFLHPGGVLGRKISLRVRDVMHRDAELPIVREGTQLVDALEEIIDDGDLKRILRRTSGNIQNLTAGEVMTRDPKTIDPGALLVVAVKTMETNRPGAITFLVSVDEKGRPEGVVHIHDCLNLPAGP